MDISLMDAVAIGNSEVIETHLKAGADIEARDKDGSTPLLRAASWNENPEMIEVLLKAGADIEAKDKCGMALSAGDVKLDEPGQDIPAYEINLPWERWKSLAQDFAGCCRLIDELLHEKTKTSHSPDFTSVMWFGTSYRFAKGHQAEIIRVFWEAWEAGGHSLSQETIGETIDSTATRFELRKVFRTRQEDGGYSPHPAWGTMIQKSTKGSYCLKKPKKRS